MRKVAQRLILLASSTISIAILGPTTGFAVSPPPAPFSWTGFYVGVDWGFERSRISGSSTTSFGTAASGDATSTMNAVGIDFRAHWYLAERWSLATGVWGRVYTNQNSSYMLDLDNFTPGRDTTVNYRRTGSVLPYAGLAYELPTFSSMAAGKAWEPNWGTWYTTVYAGPRFDFLRGSVTTNELGLMKTTDFSKTVTGFTLGLDADYPLALSGYDTSRNSRFKPVFRTGVAVDWYGSYSERTVSGLGFTYDSSFRPGPTVRGYVGVGWSLGD